MHEHYSTEEFESRYTYSGSDLGAKWTREKTLFRVWAPTAGAVSVQLYRSGTASADDLLESLPMTAAEQGTWVVEKAGDLNGVYYTYLVTFADQTVEACDPYAVTTGVNGDRAMVLDLSSTNPEGWEEDRNPNPVSSITEAVIYELHVRDMTSDASACARHRGKFLGLLESGTTPGGQKTGLDHIRSLGITHLHLLPFYDYGSVDEAGDLDSQFNWGYDPVNFNVPEGSYSTDPFHGEVRVRELKQTIKGLHDAGISVVMDVVYNHVFKHEKFCFNNIVPGYFSRISPSGKVSDASCCGNDTASERSMVRKYLVDSVKYWAEEYHIDGFRFDLVGLIDTDTINAIMEEVHRTHPHVIFYGEGWSMQTDLTKPGVALTVQPNSHMVPGFAFFSDTIRDLLRGSVFDDRDPGYASGAIRSKHELEASFMGIPHWAASPAQCVNYVSCHDNHTLFDRIALAVPGAPLEERVRMNNLAAAFSLLSQGVPFFQAGEEMLRTKPLADGGFDHNSYKSPDHINSIKWSRLDEALYQRNVEYYKGLIAFRKAHPGLRRTNREDILQNVHPLPCANPHMTAFLVEEEQERLLIIFNADNHAISVTLPDGKWKACIREDCAGTEPLRDLGGSITVGPISTLVLTQKKAQAPVDVVAALIWQKDKFLICQRPATKARGLLWEFVGGKVESGETLEQALIRECREELDVTVTVGRKFTEVIHEYPDILIRLTLFHCAIPNGFPKALEHNDIRWIHPSQIPEFNFCPADTDILKEIQRIYGRKMPL